MKVKKLVCPNCGAKLKKEQEHCEYCGTNVLIDYGNAQKDKDNTNVQDTETEVNTNIEVVKPETYTTTNTTKYYKNNKKSGKTAGTVLIILGVIFLFVAPFFGIIFIIAGASCMKKKDEDN